MRHRDQASRMVNKDVCVSAYVYMWCSCRMEPASWSVFATDADEACRFTIVSLWEDREEVGDLGKFRDMNVQVRGLVRPMHGRVGMVLSHVRQFSGGPPKFKPNPKLARGFSADESRPPINDPSLRSKGPWPRLHERARQETRPAK